MSNCKKFLTPVQRMNTLMAWSAYAPLYCSIAMLCVAACQKEYSATDKGPPVAIIAGNDTTLVMPVAQFGLDGNGSYDPGGGRLSFSWNLSTTVAGATIADPMATSTTLDGIQPGSYQIVLTVSAGDRSASDTLRLTVLPKASTNRPPVANAGIDKVSYMSSNASFTLDGSASSDPDGNIASVQWRQLSGKQSTLVSPDNLVCPFAPSDSGQYVFELMVTDAFGLTDRDTVVHQIAIQSTTPAKLYVYAGPDQILGLPLDTFYFDTRYPKTHFLSTLVNNTTATFAWQQLSGPNNALPPEATVPNSDIMNGQSFFSRKMITGTYVFRLQVTTATDAAADTIVVQVVDNTADNNTLVYQDKWLNWSSFPPEFCPSQFWFTRPDFVQNNDIINSNRLQYKTHNDTDWQPLTNDTTRKISYQFVSANVPDFLHVFERTCDKSFEDEVLAVRFFH